jgi:hypothetical protein
MRTVRLRLAALTVLLAGCYTLEPAGGIAPEPGSRIALDLTDAGRVALGGAIGPAVNQIEGRLVGIEGDEYLLAVSSVTSLRGGTQVWAGERIRVRSEHVGTVYERRLSAGRSVTLGAVAVAGITAFILSRDLLGFGREPGEGNDPKPIPVELIRP